MNKHADYRAMDWGERLKRFADPGRMRKQNADPRVERIMLPCDKKKLAEPPALLTLYAGISERNLKLAWINWKTACNVARWGQDCDPKTWPEWLSENKKGYTS